MERAMNCYVCATRGEAVPAVASCKKCGAGLCLEHVCEAALDQPAGGTIYARSHDTWSESVARTEMAVRRRTIVTPEHEGARRPLLGSHR
jgi:hypothetical protein